MVDDVVLDHGVTIDCFRKFFMDCAEHYPLRLNMETLTGCAGDNGKNLRVEEIRQLCYQKRTF